MKAYTLKKKKNAEECHLFEGYFTNTGCNTKETSICYKMNKQESEANVFICYDEKVARARITQMSKQVCKVCASLLYSTY